MCGMVACQRHLSAGTLAGANPTWRYMKHLIPLTPLWAVPLLPRGILGESFLSFASWFSLRQNRGREICRAHPSPQGVRARSLGNFCFHVSLHYLDGSFEPSGDTAGGSGKGQVEEARTSPLLAAPVLFWIAPVSKAHGSLLPPPFLTSAALRAWKCQCWKGSQ